MTVAEWITFLLTVSVLAALVVWSANRPRSGGFLCRDCGRRRNNGFLHDDGSWVCVGCLHGE